MKRRASSSVEGFTLIELMIVVAIVGILAVLAVYGVRKYVSNAKTAEARNSLGVIATDEAAAYAGQDLHVESCVVQAQHVHLSPISIAASGRSPAKASDRQIHHVPRIPVNTVLPSASA